jgi:hypothetical protein
VEIARKPYEDITVQYWEEELLNNLPNTRLQPTPAAQPKLLKEQRRAVLLREGSLWPRLKERTLK